MFYSTPGNSPRPAVGRDPSWVAHTHIDLGYTQHSPQEVDKIKELSEEFRGRNDHLLRYNCNHFTKKIGSQTMLQRHPRMGQQTAKVDKTLLVEQRVDAFVDDPLCKKVKGSPPSHPAA